MDPREREREREREMGRNTFWRFYEGVLLRGAADETGCCAVAGRERDAIQGGDVEERLGGKKNQRKTSLGHFCLETDFIISSFWMALKS